MAHHGVQQGFFKILAVAHGHALGLGFPAEGARGLHAGIAQQQLAVRHLHRAAGKAAAGVRGGIGSQGAGHIRPMQQVIAHSVAPVHGAPLPGEGVILVKQVILPLVPAKPVGVVHPAHQRRQVEQWAFFRGHLHGLLPLIFSHPVQGRWILAHRNLLHEPTGYCWGEPLFGIASHVLCYAYPRCGFQLPG